MAILEKYICVAYCNFEDGSLWLKELVFIEMKTVMILQTWSSRLWQFLHLTLIIPHTLIHLID